MTSADTKPPRRLLYVVNEDWAFLLNCLPMARAARKAGFEVHVATRVNDGARAIEAEGFTLHPIPLQRGGISPLSAIPAILALRQITAPYQAGYCPPLRPAMLRLWIDRRRSASHFHMSAR